MNYRTLSLWKRWLLHSAVFWVIINLTDIIIYLYYSNFLGITIKNYSFGDRFVNHNIHQAIPLLILIILLLVELNKLFFYKKNIWIFIAGSVGTGITGVGMFWVFNSIQHGLFQTSFFDPFWLISGYAFIYPVVLEFIKKRIFKAEQLYERSQAELIALKGQIHPHFLFNTLNSIYGTALSEGASATASSIEKLASLMRYVLNECTADFVPIVQEMNFVEEFINLQRLRLPDNVNHKVTTKIHLYEASCLIAPLLLLPFIENAFKYGLSINHECFLDLRVTVSKCQLEMSIRNSIVNDHEGSGTGINNARKRLQLLYPAKHTLDINKDENHYIVQLRIQLFQSI